MNKAADIATIRSDFIERTGLITQEEGLPRIAGRVFGMLIFDGEMVSFGELATRLQVSRASISTSIRILEERGLVKRMSKPGDRQDYFQLAPNPYVSMLEGVEKRTKATLEEIEQTIAALPKNVDAKARLQQYADFYTSTVNAIGGAVSDLKRKAQG